MTYSTWKIRENGLKRLGINFVPARLLFNPDNIRVTLGSKEGILINQSYNYPNTNNNSEFAKYSVNDILKGSSSSKYRTLYKSFIPEHRIDPQSKYSYVLNIKGRINSLYTENCYVKGTTCLDGDDKLCPPGKCFGGNISFIINKDNPSVIQCDITRGNISKQFFITNKFYQKEEEKIYDYYISPFNDKDGLIYSSDKDKEFYKLIQGQIKLPLQLLYEINGYSDFISEFLDSALIFLFRNSCQGPIEVCVKNQLDSNKGIDTFKAEIIKRISLENYTDFLKNEIISNINQLSYPSTLQEFTQEVFNIINSAFNAISYQVSSGFSLANKKSFRGELKGRPIYSRLPQSNFGYNTSGLEEDIIFTDDLDSRFNLINPQNGQLVVLNDRSEGYKYRPRPISRYEDRIKFGMPRTITDIYDPNQIYSPKDPDSWIKLESSELPPKPVTQWVIEGADELLIESKEKIDRFFNEYLNPDTCLTDSLDWLAQHVGLNDSIYRTSYSDKIKRILIKNALGWYENDLEFQIKFPNGEVKTYLTTRGSVLNDIPFNIEYTKDNLSIWSDKQQTKNRIVSSKTLNAIGIKADNTLISKNDSSNILFEELLVPETKKLINSDGYFLELDSSLSNSYPLTLVRFYGDILPDFLSREEKYFLKGVGDNKYQIFSEFGSSISIQEYSPVSDIFVENLFKVNLTDINNFIYDKNSWEGIHQSKGNRLGLAFALSLPVTKSGKFVHSHILEEIYLDTENSPTPAYRVWSGLRTYEAQSKSCLLRPWERQYLQVGDESRNFSNQLIADVSEVKEEGDSYDLIFRLPYYYNRNGRTWNYVSSVKENWLPASVSSRVQHPYLTSDLWSVGDAFFELEING